MVNIIMLKTEKGSTNGIEVNVYTTDKVYEIPESLADAFIKMKVAEKITKVAEGVKLAKKVIEPEYDKKVIEPEYDKKSKKSKKKKDK